LRVKGHDAEDDDAEDDDAEDDDIDIEVNTDKYITDYA